MPAFVFQRVGVGFSSDGLCTDSCRTASPRRLLGRDQSSQDRLHVGQCRGLKLRSVFHNRWECSCLNFCFFFYIFLCSTTSWCADHHHSSAAFVRSVNICPPETGLSIRAPRCTLISVPCVNEIVYIDLKSVFFAMAGYLRSDVFKKDEMDLLKLFCMFVCCCCELFIALYSEGSLRM